MTISKEVLDRLWLEATTPAHWFPSAATPDASAVCLVEPWLLQDIVRALRAAPPEGEAQDPIPMAKQWIEDAKCGNCGGVGWRAIQVEAGVFEQDQCQWCFEKWLALGQPSSPMNVGGEKR